MSETSRPRLLSVDVGTEVVVAKGKLQGQRGTVVSKKVGWYKVQVDGVEEVGSFRLADISSEETSTLPSTKTQPPPSSPLKNAASQSPLKRKAPSSPFDKNAPESSPKRNASSSSPLKGRNNASPSPAARAAVAVTAGTPRRRAAVSRDSGLPPRCPPSTPAGESAVAGLLNLRRSSSGNGDNAVSPPATEASRPLKDGVPASEGSRDADSAGAGGRGSRGEEVSSSVADAKGKEAVGEGGEGGEGVDRGNTEAEDSGGEETETDLEIEAGEEIGGQIDESGQEGRDGMDVDGGDTEGEEEEQEEEEGEEEEGDEEEEEEEVDIEAMVKLAAAAARKHALALSMAPGGDSADAGKHLSTASNEGNAGTRKRLRGGGRAPTALDTGLPSPKYLRYAGGGKRESLTASVASDAVGGSSKAAKLMAASALYSGRDRAMLLERSKAPKDDTAGKGWFNMEQAEMTPELKRDLQVIRMRNYVDPKRFYKASDKVSKFMQIGTVKEGAAEFFSSRMTNKERKTTLVDELLVADDAFRAYSKNQYGSIQSRKRAGGKAQYNDQRRKRKGGMKWKP